MSEITAIVPQKKDKTRCNIEVDGRFFCGMKLMTVMQYRLKAGMTIAAERLAEIQLESEKETALDKALYHITATMKTEQQVRDFLKRKGYLREVQDYVIEKLREYRYLDDAAYARAYAEEMAKKKGPRLIEMELRQKGISEEAVGEAIGSITGEEDAAKSVLKRYLRGKDTADRAVLRKAYSYLLSKGFDYETAKGALEGIGDED